MDKQNLEKNQIMPKIRALEVDAKTSFPLARINYVKNACYLVSMQCARRYRTHINKPEVTIEVTRVK